MRSLLLVAVGGMLAACGLDPVPTEPASRAPATSGQLVTLSAPWPPPWSGPDTPAEVAERPLAPFCGVEEGFAINAAIRQCFVAEATAGRPVEFATVATTTEGDPFATISGFDAVAGVNGHLNLDGRGHEISTEADTKRGRVARVLARDARSQSGLPRSSAVRAGAAEGRGQAAAWRATVSL